MNRRSLLRAVAATCIVSAAVWVLAKPFVPDPLAARACNTCHVGDEDRIDAAAALLRGTQEQLCAECHPAAVKLSHPSGIRPGAAGHADYPLDWKGELTCSSCHEIHRGSHGALRGARRGREFCVSCHGAQFFDRMADRGESLVVSGHLDAGAGVGGRLLDPFTAQCMFCHGEAGDGRVTVGEARNSSHTGKGLNHPVGVRYAESEQFGGYRRRASLDPAIELPGGLVSCVSCHQGYSARHGGIRTAQRGTGLCMECHDL